MQCRKPILVKGGYVPCGKCPNCLANQRQEWVFRLRSEYLNSKFALFVTLTYDPEHYPATGTCKRDVQLFLKRLRKACGNKSFRYYIVSEYGDNTCRGHYHGIFSLLRIAVLLVLAMNFTIFSLNPGTMVF